MNKRSHNSVVIIFFSLAYLAFLDSIAACGRGNKFQAQIFYFPKSA
jgi:hypothetical protein